jgi:mannose-1-phosphate guanylyltransferase
MSPRKQGDRRGAAVPAYAVIMAGGGSTRLWPLGRARRPKQVISILGKKTLLQATVDRLVATFSHDRILIVTGAAHAAEVRRQVPRIARDHILVEPMGRNTTACIALAAEWLAARVGEVVMVATPTDHVVADAAGERASIETAIALAAKEQCVVTIGIVPAKPEIAYGYIECGARLPRLSPPACWVKRFHEKPSAATARRYLAGGKHLWNAGIFVAPTSVFRRALTRYAGNVARPLAGIWQGRGASAVRIRRAYAKIPSLPIDVSVMQPLSRRPRAIAVVRGAFDWIDAGNWDAMGGLWPRDNDGNSAHGRLLAIDSTDSIVYSAKNLVALLGVHNLVVVDAGDVILVCARERAQDVRKVSEALRKLSWSRYL